MGLEPTPGPWQGPVLPLYYGRPNQRNFNTPAIRRQEPRGMEMDGDFSDTTTPSGLPGQASIESPQDGAISRLATPARSLRQETFAASQQIWMLSPCPCIRVQTVPRPCKTQSPASACAFAADLSQAWCVFVRF